MDRQAATDCGGWRAGHNGGDATPFNRAELGLGIAFAVGPLDCYTSSGSLDLSMRVGIIPC